MAWSLRNQMLLTSCGLIIITLITVSAFDAWLSVMRSDRRLHQQIAAMNDALKHSDYPLTSTVLQQMKSYSNAEFVVTDPQGEIFSSSFDISRDTWQAVKDHLPAKEETVVELQGIAYFHTATRTSRPNSPEVHILFPLTSWQEDRWETAWQHLLVGVVALAVACGVAIRLANKLSDPIGQLNQQIQRIAQGNFQHVPPPERPTELHELATAVNQMVDELTAMSQTIQRTERLSLIAQLSAGLAHQLRNAIAGASLAIEVHELKCKSDAESLAVAKRQLKITADQIRRLLTAKNETHATMETVDLTQVLSNTLELLRPTFDYRQINLQADLTNEPCVLSGNSDQLQQMVTEIALNALDAAGLTGMVKFSLQKVDGIAILRISDSGTGIPAELRDRIFEPFVTGKTEGIGLGLTAARQIAQLHGGNLRLMPDSLNTFEISLPVN